MATKTQDLRQLLKEGKFTDIEKSDLISIGLGKPATGQNLYALNGADPEIIDDILLMLCLSGKVGLDNGT